MLNQDFSFKCQLGKDTLKSPRDVKLTKEYIFVLDVLTLVSISFAIITFFRRVLFLEAKECK